MRVEEMVIPDDIHDFLLWRSWKTVTTATGEFFERKFISRAPGFKPVLIIRLSFSPAACRGIVRRIGRPPL